MPKLIMQNFRRPYSIPSEFRGWKWPGDTDEGRTARADWAKYFAYGCGEMDLADMPRSIALQKVSNMKPMFLAGFWVVEEVVKEIMEGIDPERHQFVPISLTTWMDRPLEDGKWFMMNVYCHQSSIIDDMTNAKPVRGYEETREKMLLNYLIPKITVDSAKLSQDIHFWREDRYLDSLFMSDALYERLKAIGIVLPVHETGILETS